MRKILAFILSLVLLCCLLPAAAGADNVQVFVDGTPLIDDTPYNGDRGTAVWDAATKTLTLTDFSLSLGNTEADGRIWFVSTDAVTIHLVGSNNVSNNEGTAGAVGIHSAIVTKGDLTITGDAGASLTADGKLTPVNVGGALTISGPIRVETASSLEYSCGISTVGMLTIKEKAEVEARGDYGILVSAGGVNVDDSTLTVTTSTGTGLEVLSGDIAIRNSTVTIEANEEGILAENGAILLDANVAVTSKTKDAVVSRGTNSITLGSTCTEENDAVILTDAIYGTSFYAAGSASTDGLVPLRSIAIQKPNAVTPPASGVIPTIPGAYGSDDFVWVIAPDSLNPDAGDDEPTADVPAVDVPAQPTLPATGMTAAVSLAAALFAAAAAIAEKKRG